MADFLYLQGKLEATTATRIQVDFTRKSVQNAGEQRCISLELIKPFSSN